jgi:PHP family Zn ribbon phosphoesterase
MRAGQVHLQPGYDGKYGIIKVFNEEELKKIRGEQKTLF